MLAATAEEEEEEEEEEKATTDYTDFRITQIGRKTMKARQDGPSFRGRGIMEHRTARWVLPLLVLCLAGLILCTGCTLMLKDEVIAAKTPQEEAAVFAKVNTQTLGYSVEAYDLSAQKVPMTEKGWWRRTTSIVIEWPDGTVANRVLMDPNNVFILMRE
jgi:hypothetical protein